MQRTQIKLIKKINGWFGAWGSVPKSTRKYIYQSDSLKLTLWFLPGDVSVAVTETHLHMIQKYTIVVKTTANK